MTIAQQYRDYLQERMKASIVDIAGFARGTMAVRLLSDEEVSAARIAAYKHIEDECKESGIRALDLIEAEPEALDRERMRRIVHTAFVDAATADSDTFMQRPALDMGMVRALDTVSVDEMYDVYLAHQASKTIRINLKPDELDALVEQLRVPGSEAVLSTLDENALRLLILAIVRTA